MRRLLLLSLLVTAMQFMCAEPVYFEAGGIKYQYFDGENYYIGGYSTWTGTEMIRVPKEGNVCIVAENPDYTGTDLVIPEKVSYNGSDDVRVVGIAPGAFKGNQYITSVSFPITFPQKWEQYNDVAAGTRPDLFGKCAFEGCSNLTKVVFPEGMKKIYVSGSTTPFKGCPISELVIPQSLTDLTEVLKESAVKTIDIPEWVTNVSFQGCAQLTEVPALLGMTVVPQYCFSGCNSLENATLPVNAVTVERGVFSGCKNLENIVIPDKVTEVRFNVGSNCPKLKKVVIGSSVKKLGTGCFSGSNAIEVVEFKSTTPPGLYNYGDPTTTEKTAHFFTDDVLKKAYFVVPDGSLNAYRNKPYLQIWDADGNPVGDKDDVKVVDNTSFTTGIDTVAAEHAEAGAAVEYFNLRGVQVSADALVPGVYVKKSGNVVKKILVR